MVLYGVNMCYYPTPTSSYRTEAVRYDWTRTWHPGPGRPTEPVRGSVPTNGGQSRVIIEKWLLDVRLASGSTRCPNQHPGGFTMLLWVFDAVVVGLLILGGSTLIRIHIQ